MAGFLFYVIASLRQQAKQSPLNEEIAALALLARNDMPVL
jgi:hypothetical protein